MNNTVITQNEIPLPVNEEEFWQAAYHILDYAELPFDVLDYNYDETDPYTNIYAHIRYDKEKPHYIVGADYECSKFPDNYHATIVIGYNQPSPDIQVYNWMKRRLLL